MPSVQHHLTSPPLSAGEQYFDDENYDIPNDTDDDIDNDINDDTWSFTGRVWLMASMMSLSKILKNLHYFDL